MMSSDKQYANPAVAAPPAESSVLSRLAYLAQTSSRLNDLASGSESLADRIAGTAPGKDAGGKPSAVPNGLADQIAEITENLNAHVRRIELANQRIDTAIG